MTEKKKQRGGPVVTFRLKTKGEFRQLKKMGRPYKGGHSELIRILLGFAPTPTPT